MNTLSKHAEACLKRLIPQLTGLTITGGAIDATGEFWGFTAQGEQNGQPVEKTVFVLADPEGNGPGWLEIGNNAGPDPAAEACGRVRETCKEEHEAGAKAQAPLFLPGQVVATPGALNALEKNEADASVYLDRHLRGDWGELCEEDRQANQEALEQGLRLLSAYRLEDGTRIWIITEADRSATTLLLPDEY